MIDWSSRPWGKPVVSGTNPDVFAATGVAASVSFRYHGMKIRGWALEIVGGAARLVMPRVESSMGGTTHTVTAAYFLSPEQDKQFKEDLMAILNFTAEYGIVPGWVEGMQIR